jgi:hypothetical protein
MTVPLAHIAGVPVEESAPLLAQAAAAGVYLLGMALAWLRGH